MEVWSKASGFFKSSNPQMTEERIEETLRAAKVCQFIKGSSSGPSTTQLRRQLTEAQITVHIAQGVKYPQGMVDWIPGTIIQLSRLHHKCFSLVLSGSSCSPPLSLSGPGLGSMLSPFPKLLHTTSLSCPAGCGWRVLGWLGSLAPMSHDIMDLLWALAVPSVSLWVPGY